MISGLERKGRQLQKGGAIFIVNLDCTNIFSNF